jgi:hypothetical protein
VDIIVLQVFVSLMLVVGSVILFAWTVRKRTFEHADRLALLPIEQETTQPSSVRPGPGPRSSTRPGTPEPKTETEK